VKKNEKKEVSKERNMMKEQFKEPEVPKKLISQGAESGERIEAKKAEKKEEI